MNALQTIADSARRFATPALAILKRCEQSGLQLHVEGDHLKAKGSREIITSWQRIIQRHKPEIIATLSGLPSTSEHSANDEDTLLADYDELTACIVELCQLAAYEDEARDRMLAARRNLFPSQYAAEAAYFCLQVIRSKAGTYWNSHTTQ